MSFTLTWETLLFSNTSCIMTGPLPGWQTEELRDEWPDLEQEGDDDTHDLSYGTQSVSLTVPLSSEIHSTNAFHSNTLNAKGTFIVREDVPLLPKTPGRNKNPIKDFFTPLPLERMFEPPSPSPPLSAATDAEARKSDPLSEPDSPCRPESRLGSQGESVETHLPTNHGHSRMECKFTFTVPRAAPPQPTSINTGVLPQAQSTPNPVMPTRSALSTDPRLRLFQFQYDTYTREHLSALVDSIAVNTPSGTGTGTTPTPTSFFHLASRLPNSGTRIRSSKRVKLSPLSDFREETATDNISVTRPIPKDYIGESKSLIQQIKLAKDYSTISTVASAPNHTAQNEKSMVDYLKTSLGQLLSITLNISDFL